MAELNIIIMFSNFPNIVSRVHHRVYCHGDTLLGRSTDSIVKETFLHYFLPFLHNTIYGRSLSSARSYTCIIILC